LGHYYFLNNIFSKTKTKTKTKKTKAQWNVFMLVRVLSLLFFTSQAWSAGITIELDSAVTIGQFEYTDTYEWDDLEVNSSNVESYRYKRIEFSGEAPKSLRENDNNGIEILGGFQ